MKFAKRTLDKMAAYEAAGYTILVGNDPTKRAGGKWEEVVRLAQTNSRRHGWSVRTVYAVKPASP